MKQLIETAFEVLAVGFNKIPFMKKLEGWRSIMGLAGLLIVSILKKQGLIPDDVSLDLILGFSVWTGLALNSKGR